MNKKIPSQSSLSPAKSFILISIKQTKRKIHYQKSLIFKTQTASTFHFKNFFLNISLSHNSTIKTTIINSHIFKATLLHPKNNIINITRKTNFLTVHSISCRTKPKKKLSRKKSIYPICIFTLCIFLLFIFFSSKKI